MSEKLKIGKADVLKISKTIIIFAPLNSKNSGKNLKNKGFE